MKEMLSSVETQNADILKIYIFHRLNVSISEPELCEKQDSIPARKNHPSALVSYVFRRSPSPSSSLTLSFPVSIKDHEVWHLQEEGQEHCFPLALFPCCRLSAMVMPRANCCLNPFQGCFNVPCNFHRSSAAAAVMKHAPLLWSVLLSSPICNLAPFFCPDLSAPSTPTSRYYLGHS